MNTTRFDESSDLSTTYLKAGQTELKVTNSRQKNPSYIRTGIYIREIIRWEQNVNYC